MADMDDPFQRVPREFDTPVPPGAPPPGGVPSSPRGGPSAAAAAAAAGQGAVEERWKRRWGTTMGRWGVGWAVVLGLAIAVGPALVRSTSAVPLGSDEVYEFVGYVFGTATIHLVFFGWWLDHIVAVLGRRAALGLHLAGVGLLNVMGASSSTYYEEYSVIPGSLVFMVPLVLVALWQLVTMRWRDAFPPVGARPGSTP